MNALRQGTALYLAQRLPLAVLWDWRRSAPVPWHLPPRLQAAAGARSSAGAAPTTGLAPFRRRGKDMHDAHDAPQMCPAVMLAGPRSVPTVAGGADPPAVAAPRTAVGAA